MTTTHDTTGLREQIARVICERGGTSWDFYAQEAPLMAEGLREVADAILAHLTAEGLLGAGWRPIAEAPRDGTNFLGGWTYLGSWKMAVCRFAPNGNCVSYPGTWKYEPQFWTPLPPAPPQVAQAEGEGS